MKHAGLENQALMAPVEPSEEEQSLCEGSNSAVSMELSETVVENGETEMSPEESREHKEEISEAEPVGGSLGGGRPPEEGAQEMMEEEEEIPKPKSVVAPPGAPKKEHVNVVFIGHVVASPLLKFVKAQLYLLRVKGRLTT
ncbi:Eukaryotic Peptide Chain Release Factor Gtp-Binding Subunit Erf3A [Manis pentadactyla]|nr:Eukaryotic Peptide Chain Release Factor Gtp-Binding Subunit Erf3A [Manis pentadactyla]